MLLHATLLLVKPLLPTHLLVKLIVLWIATPKAGDVPLVMAITLMADIVPKVATPIPRAVSVASWDAVTSALVVRALHPYIRNKVIVCPNKDKLGVCAAAKKAYHEWWQSHTKGTRNARIKLSITTT